MSIEVDYGGGINASWRGSDRSGSVDCRDGAEARALFIQEKHKPETGKHVGFTDTVVEISQDNVVTQEVIGTDDLKPASLNS